MDGSQDPQIEVCSESDSERIRLRCNVLLVDGVGLKFRVVI